MSRTSVVSREDFVKIVIDLGTNSDFFDPFYLEQEDWEPLKHEYVKELASSLQSHGITEEDYTEVVDFLQTYSDVDLMAYSRYALDRVDLIRAWYTMYLEEKTTWPEPGDRRVR
jgi:hypothetical protein